MKLFSFIKDAGEKLLGVSDAKPPAPSSDPAAANAAAGRAIENYIRKMGLDAEDLRVAFDAGKGAVAVSGRAATQEMKEKILLCCGNLKGVSDVRDDMEVAEKTAEPRFYTVVSGDTLSKIAKQHYGNANAYTKIFEANRPMLTHPDKIYPGQTLRIPD